VKKAGSIAVFTDVFLKGGEGGKELAEEVVKACEIPSKMEFPYALEEGVCEKIENIAKKIYGADGVDFSEEALAKIKTIEEKGCGNLPVIIAKTQMAASQLSASMKKGLWQKKYHALAEGIVSPTEQIIDAPIEREAEGSIKRIVRPDGKSAKTKYSLIEVLDGNSLCEVTLYTGRTHQIRVHFAHIGHPLVSDYLYGSPSDKEYYLRCKEITFPHPKTNKIISIKA
jgi:23S rRNA pseudouridine1911/1915/1917 synthase